MFNNIFSKNSQFTNMLTACYKRVTTALTLTSSFFSVAIRATTRVATFATAFLTFFLISCSNNGTSKCADATNIPNITVSVPPLEFFANAIGGDSINITTLLPSGGDPETFEPGVTLMRNLAQSDAFITIGLLPFEQSLISNIKANNPQLIIARVDSAITFIHGTHEHRHGTHEHHSDNGAVDPHIWSSVNNAPIIAQNVLNALVAAAPNHANYYRQRFYSLAAQLHSMKAEFDSCFMAHPTTDFLIWHPALSYFARDYGMNQIPLNIENKETSPLQLKQAIDRAAIGNASLLIMPEGTPADRAAAITAKLGIKTVPVLLMTADWDNSMRQLLSTFTSNQ